MRSRYFLIFLTLVLLVVPSISTIAIAGSGSGGGVYPVPRNLQRGDIILIRRVDRTNDVPWFEHLVYWNHAMICETPGSYTPTTCKVYHAWNGVEHQLWSDAMLKNNRHGGVKYLGIVRVTTDWSIITRALNFIAGKVGKYYDSYSQRADVVRKQIQPYKDWWWFYKLPPRDYYGSHRDPNDWIENFTFNERVDEWDWDNGHHRYGYPANEYYCTELVWAAYFEASQGYIYLEKTPDLRAIRGWEIWADNDIVGHPSPSPSYQVGNPHPEALDEN